MHCGSIIPPRCRAAICYCDAPTASARLLSGSPRGRGQRRRSASRSRAKPDGAQPPHYKAKAKSVIFLFMDGGPSQVEHLRPQATPGQNTASPSR